MPARDIGLRILPHLAGTGPFNMYGQAITLAGERADRDSIAALLMEGLAYLQQIGFVVPDPRYRGEMLILSRAGRKAAAANAAAGGYDPRAMPIEAILNPAIVRDALPELDRGPDHYSVAIFIAFRLVETTVRAAAGFSDNRIGVPLMNAAFGPNGPLRDPTVDAGEAEALRSLFAGAIGAYKNPHSHRADVELRDPAEAIRLLAFASQLTTIAEDRGRRLAASSANTV